MYPRAPFRRLSALALLPFALAACAPATVVHSGPAPVPNSTAGIYLASTDLQLSESPRRSDHVVVISIDGLRPDAIDRFGAHTLQRLMDEGSYSLEARTIFPSITLPSHTSMVTGVEPRIHGITWNDNRVAETGRVQVPTIFSVAREQGLHTAAFFSKGKFEHLLLPGSVDHAVLPEGDGKWLSGTTADAVEEYLAAERPNLVFVHFGEPDYAGHLLGWMGIPYGWAVRRADGAVARVLEAADAAFGKGQYTVIVTADHGGHGRTHGTQAATDMTIPWIAWGRGVRSEGELPRGIHTTDTAATVLWLLGLETPEVYAGVPVLTAFSGSETAVASF